MTDVVAFFKQYWDIIGGAFAGLGIAALAKFELLAMQMCYTAIILIIVCIGLLRLIRQSTQKAAQDDREPTAIDAVVDSQKPIKAISLAQAPDKAGEKVGKKILKFWGVTKKMMDKFKTFFDKFKGFMLTIALAILTVVEMCGGFINSALGGVLVINGVEVLPLVTLVCSIVVGIISNGYTKEQRDKIKALFSEGSTKELVRAEIKKQIKEKNAQLTQLNKTLAAQQHERAELESKLEMLNNALSVKLEMRGMDPQLATDEDVQLATDAVTECQEQINAKTNEISATEEAVKVLTTTLNALRSQM